MAMKRRSVGILIFDGVEVLDFAGPLEVLAAARVSAAPDFTGWQTAPAPFLVFTVAKDHRTISATAGLRVEPAYSFDDHPPIDVLVVPGGAGVRAIIESHGSDSDRATPEWIRRVAGGAELVASVCTGAWLLAQANLLRGRPATTHFLCLERLAELDPTISIRPGQRVVDDGGVITSAGVAAGLDMALHIVARLCGQTAADATATYIEYPGLLTTTRSADRTPTASRSP